MNTEIFTGYKEKIVNNCGRVIVGKDEVIRKVLIAFICSGHVLLEDLPGTGKTMLLRAFARSVGGSFGRIQFTPDLTPSDLTGIHFYNQKTGEFEFRPGPLFSGIILADEINRATPRTQSSLLEAMEERQITVDGISKQLKEPFFVMASQNPLESYGTFPLPDAQMDRFFMRLNLGYMNREQEMSVIVRPSTLSIVQSLECVVTPEETEQVRAGVPEIYISDPVLQYVMDIVEATRKESNFVHGVSTRGAMALVRAAKASAALSGRDFVIPEDVRDLAPAVLGHRLAPGTGLRTGSVDEFLGKIISGIPVPLETP